MNKIWLFLCFLCMSWAARGQSAYNWVYWFDENHAQMLSGTADNTTFSIDAETSALDEGFHTFHVQVADAEGNYSPPKTQMFYQSSNRIVTSLHYWFDGDMEHLYSASSINGNISVDVSMLEPGIHFMYFQAEDITGCFSNVSIRCFYRQLRAKGARWSYWFDEDEEMKQTIQLTGDITMVDVSELSEGFHTIHHQVSELVPSEIVTRWFFKIPQTEGLGEMTCICTVDEKMVAQAKVSANGGILSWQMDVESLDVGIHRAVFQIITPSGAASTIAERFFVRTMTNNEWGKMHCVYSIDNFQTSNQAAVLVDGVFHFDFDVASLENGLHRLAYMLVSEEGVTTPQKTAFFWKIPLGGAGIVQYDYWLNDDTEHKHTTRLDSRKDPFKLISLLPVEAQPIRSSCFHFEVKDNKPMIYAKNDFHLRFFDTSAYNISETRQFIDYSVNQEVMEIMEIEDNKVFTMPDINQIKWFKLHALTGDSIAFKCNRACTIQVFSESGIEILRSQGSNSIIYSGAHIPEEGTYYVAIHDVTAKQTGDLSLSFQHFDKYCVLKKTPEVIGNLSNTYFVLSLVGNGFDKLQSAYITKGTNVLHADSVTHQGYSSAKLYFTIISDDLENGLYNLVLNYQDESIGESLVVTDAISLVAPELADLEVWVTQPSITQSPYSISVHVKNVGYVGYTYVPLRVSFDNILKISDIMFDNFFVATPTEADSLGYQFLALTDSLFGKPIPGGMMFLFIPRIEAGEEQVYTFSVSSSEPFQFYAWTGIPIELEEMQDTQASRIMKASPHETACHIQSFGNQVASITGNSHMPINVNLAGQAAKMTTNVGVGLAAVHNGLGNAVHEAQIEAYHLSDDDAEILRSMYPSVITPGSFLDMFLAHSRQENSMFARKGRRNSRIDGIMDNQQNNVGCPLPPNGGNHIQPKLPVDPNDILGYNAESGSKAIHEGLSDVYYTIEFENDHEQATASAFHIYLTDTLDKSKFDLSTFVPTHVKIGEKSTKLTGNKNFVTTIDMRPEINAIAQVEGTFDEQKGIAKWHISSLDPMTMEPTDDVMQGVLPVNTNDNGIGEVSYNISLRSGLLHGTHIDNRAGIVFDNNEEIITPTWTNVTDYMAPESYVADVQMVTDEVAEVYIEATDELSGPWRYDVYVQYGNGAAWWKVAENIPIDSMAQVKVYDGINHGFYVVATDSAGNVEVKDAAREFTLRVGLTPGDANNDGVVNIADVTAVINQINGVQTAAFRRKNADVNDDGNINIADVTGIINIINK